MLDGVLLRMVEEATHAGYPLDAAAVLLIELEGLHEAVEEQVEEIRAACAACHAREFRVARDQLERDLLWKGRKNALARSAAARPITIPRTEWCRARKPPRRCKFMEGVSQRYGLVISNIFHAGDGNLHPLILFDHRIPGQLEKVKQASDEILRFCISVGGSITGEHGVGMEKNRDDGAPVLLRYPGHDRAVQETLRPGMPSKPREGSAHRTRLHGNSSKIRRFESMKQLCFISFIAGLLCFGGERKQLPGQAGNDDVDLEASVILTHDEVTQAIGSDIGEGYIVVRMKVIPKGTAPLRIGPDDFTIISRKDGQRSQALAPSEIAGKGAMVVKHGTADGSKSSWGVGGMGAGLGSTPEPFRGM